jgi:predicted nucleic acid-binding Zn ribbon protein
VSRRRAPRSLAAPVSAALERAEPATLLAAVQSAWPGAVGDAIAREATPVGERDGVVTVACSSATWAHELDLLGPEILGKTRSRVHDGGALRGFRFTASADRD